MNTKPLPPDDSWESDAVWKLLDQVTPRLASARFGDDTLRAARLAGTPRRWWLRLLAPAPLAGLTATAAALAIAVLALHPTPGYPAGPIAATSDEAFAGIQELAEAEVLSAAVDNLDNFTDTELVCLIGF
ncbi:MAG: hypothetical protein DVB25_04180 [Verrucomicrobia bacterium]|nr:MAG: hypothetical protein DVB25_04180 [Verrucomicrobiota bacterium]